MASAHIMDVGVLEISQSAESVVAKLGDHCLVAQVDLNRATFVIVLTPLDTNRWDRCGHRYLAEGRSITNQNTIA